MPERFETSKLHVVAGWDASRYPGPNAEETGYRLTVAPPPDASNERQPMITVVPPPSLTAQRAVDSTRPAPSGAGPGASRGLFDLTGLLARAWSVRGPGNPGGSSASPRPDSVPLGIGTLPDGPGPATPRPLERPAFVPPTALPLSKAPSITPSPEHAMRPALALGSTPHGASEAAPRLTHAWICPFCHLTNAPWAPACPSCRRVAPAL